MIHQRKQNRPAHIIIDRSAFIHNVQFARQLVQQTAPRAKMMAVIKADGYGHGMDVAAECLSEVDEFGVNSLDDVHRLRTQGIDKPLTLLSATLNLQQLNQLSHLNVRTVCYDFEQINLFEQVNQGANLSVWIKIDTGMGRLGFSSEELETVYRRLSRAPGISALNLMTHLANADNPHHPQNEAQIASIRIAAEKYAFDDLSILNSAGVIHYPQAAASVVRPGLMLYGISPVPGKSSFDLGLKPVMTFKSELISVKKMKAGSTIGYGSRYTLDADSRIGIVACGYGDGYPRHAPSGTPVLVNDTLVPLIGRVSMDMMAVELGEIPAKVGDQVVLWGEQNPVEEIGKASGTIAYELTCGILPRVERLVI